MSDQIQTLNYCAHAIEDLRELEVVYARIAPKSALVVKQLIKLLQNSIKFLLPNHCDIIDPDDLKQAHLDIARLPFPCVAFEASFEQDDGIRQLGGFQQLPATKRIALCWEAIPEYEIIPGLFSILDKFPDGGVFIVPIYWGPQHAKWTVALGGAFFPYANCLQNVSFNDALPVSRIANSALIDAGLGKPNAKQYLAEPFYLFPEIFERAVEQYGSVDQAYAQITLDSRDETMMLIQACSVINCANVTTAEIPASLALNKKRVERGKQPFFTYKVLELTNEPTGVGKGSGGGSHASPRMHLRRGHLRRLDDKVVWVRPSMINAGATHGMVTKDYSIKLGSN